MENSFLTSGDLAMWDAARTSRSAYPYEAMYGHKCDHTATTGVGLAAGLGGGALLLALAGLWGVNQASKARARGAENLANANQRAIDILAQNHLAERQSRETWQNTHAPSMTQYVDVRSTSGAGAGANALSLAEALAIAQNNNGLNSAIGGCNFLRVARYAPPQGCGCDTCNC